MKEAKGARTFFGFATLSFPVLASQMGAMIFSLFGRAPEGMPQPLVFSLVNLGTVTAVVVLTLTIGISMSYFGFRVLGRHRAALLTGLFTLANLAVLVPVREGLPAGVLIAGVAAVIYWFDATTLGEDFRLVNFEGRVCRLMLTAPLLVMIGRNLFYPVDAAYAALVLAIAGAYLAFHWGRRAGIPAVRGLCQLAGLAVLTIAWFLFMVPSLVHVDPGEGVALYLLLLPIAVVAGLNALTAEASFVRSWRLAAAAIAVGAVLAAHLVDGAPLVSIIGVLVSMAIIVLGVLAGTKLIALSGCAAAVASLGNVAVKAVAFHADYTWVMLAGVGILVLLAASVAERGGGVFRRKVMVVWGRLGR